MKEMAEQVARDQRATGAVIRTVRIRSTCFPVRNVHLPAPARGSSSDVSQDMALPHVSSEGGPILVGDSRRVCEWRGIDGDGSDYALACATIESSSLGAIDGSMIAWDFGGPGTGFIISCASGFDFVRVWTDEELDDNTIRRLAATAVFDATRIKISVPSGILVFLWATELGTSIASLPGNSGVPVGDFSMGGVSHCEKVEAGEFRVQVSEGDSGSLAFTAIRIQKG